MTGPESIHVRFTSSEKTRFDWVDPKGYAYGMQARALIFPVFVVKHVARVRRALDHAFLVHHGGQRPKNRRTKRGSKRLL